MGKRLTINSKYNFQAWELHALLKEYEATTVLSDSLLNRLREMLGKLTTAVEGFGYKTVVELVGEDSYDRFLMIFKHELPRTLEGVRFLEDYRK